MVILFHFVSSTFNPLGSYEFNELKNLTIQEITNLVIGNHLINTMTNTTNINIISLIYNGINLGHYPDHCLSDVVNEQFVHLETGIKHYVICC